MNLTKLILRKKRSMKQQYTDPKTIFKQFTLRLKITPKKKLAR